MLYKDNKAYDGNVNGATVPFLPTYAPQNGARLNERKEKSVKLSGVYYKIAEQLDGNSSEAMRKRAGRVYGCAMMRDLAVNDQGYAYTIGTRRCRDRNCLECSRVRAFSLQQKIRDITPALIAETNTSDALIFGTLTIKNPPITDLKICLKVMSKAFARMLARKDFKRVAVGGFRCFETTRGESGSELCHPHIHFLLQVKKEYFPTTSPLYIKNETWAEAWTDCLDLEFKKYNDEEEKKFLKSIEKENIKDNGNIENFIKKTKEENKKPYIKKPFNFNREDYPNGRAFVKILRVQTPESAKKKLKNPVYASIGTLQTEGDQVINYVLKYSSGKEEENGKKALIKNDAWFAEYDKNIRGIRAISFFGVYKTLIAKIEDKEYDEQDVKAGIENNGENSFYTAIYDDDHKYVLIKTTEAEALERKRANMVKGAFNTLKIQLESKIRIFDILDDALKSNNILKAQDEIENLNSLSLRIYKTFKRIERLGEVLEDENGFNQHFHNYIFENKLFENMSNLLSAEEIKAIKKAFLATLEKIEVIENNPPF